MWCLIESWTGLRVFSTISNQKLKPLPGTGSLPSDWNVTRISIRDKISESVSLRALWAFLNWLNKAPDPEGARQQCHFSLWMNQSGHYQQWDRIKRTIEGKFLWAFSAWDEDYIVFIALINTDIYEHVFDLPKEENDGWMLGFTPKQGFKRWKLEFALFPLRFSTSRVLVCVSMALTQNPGSGAKKSFLNLAGEELKL